jgi:hypothetical protein
MFIFDHFKKVALLYDRVRVEVEGASKLYLELEKRCGSETLFFLMWENFVRIGSSKISHGNASDYTVFCIV